MGVDDACGDFTSSMQEHSRDLVASLAQDVEMYAEEPDNFAPGELDALRRGIKAVERGEPYALTRLMNLAWAVDMSHNVFPELPGCAQYYVVLAREKVAAAVAAIVAADDYRAANVAKGEPPHRTVMSEEGRQERSAIIRAVMEREGLGVRERPDGRCNVFYLDAGEDDPRTGIWTWEQLDAFVTALKPAKRLDA
jgi:hypothetical protein